jgi:hypothetical protein
MPEERYKLVRSVGAFDEGELLDVAARFGDWHVYDVRLEPANPARKGSVELTHARLQNVAERTDAET